MIKKILFFYILIGNLHAHLPLEKLEGDCKNPKNFTQKQKEIILNAYQHGKQKEFGYILAAIAWQESCAGKYLINFSDPSAGIYHAHLPTVIKKYSKLKDTSFNRNIVGQLLIQDQDFATKVALDQLLLWRKKFGTDNSKIIKSYNKGTAWIKNQNIDKRAEQYLHSIKQKIALLENFIPKLVQEQKINKQNRSTFHNKVDTIQTQKIQQEFYLLRE